jgi:O-antigen ligase
MGVYLAKAEFEYFFHGAGQYRMGVWRLLGIEETYGDPNSVAGSTVLSLPILYCLWKVRRQFTETWPRIWRRVFPLCLVLYFVLATMAVVLTNSRSGMLGIAVFLFLTVLVGASLRRKVVGTIGALVLIGVIWLVMPEESRNRLRTVWDPSQGPKNAQESAEGRIEGLKAGWAMFTGFPLTGVGIGSFAAYRVAYGDGVDLNAHNLIGQMLGETGALGTGAFALMLAALFTNCRRTKALATERPCETAAMLSRLAVACRDSVILLVFFGMFGHNMLRFNWLWLAAFALLCRRFSEAVCNEEDNQSRLGLRPDLAREMVGTESQPMRGATTEKGVA